MAPAEGHRASSGRNAPPTAEHQYNVSNKTVNKFLGGRQPSWMTSSLSVKPTPRPLNRPPKESLPESVPARINLSQQPRHQRQKSSTSVAQVTQPKPSAAAPFRSQLPPRLPPPPAPAQTHVVASASSAILPSPALSDEPSPAVSALIEVSNPLGNQPAPDETNPAPATSVRFELLHTVGAIDVEGSDAQNPVRRPSNTTTSDAQTSQTTSAPSPPSGAAQPLHVPPTQSTSTSRPMTANLPLSPSGNQERPAKRRRTGNMAHSLLSALAAIENIDNQIQQTGGEDGLDVSVERPRYQLLRNACHEGDLFFVALHQIFCSWSFSNSIAHKLCAENRRDPNLIDNAFGLVGTILKSNSKLRLEHAQFFRDFPASLEDLRTQVPLYAQMISQVLLFLTQLSHAWMIVNNDHKRMGYPLLMDELLGIFGLNSTTLQTIVFRASRRTLGVLDGDIGQKMDELFQQDQRAHMDSNGNFFTRTAENYQSDSHNKVLIHKYCALVAQAHASRQAFRQVSNHGHQPVHQQQHQHQHSVHQMNHHIQSTNSNSTAMMYGPGAEVQQSSGQSVPYTTNTQFTSTSPVGNSYAFAPNANQPYQVPPLQFPVLQNSASINSPNSGHFSNAASPVQSPIMNQGQYFQMPGRSVNQFAGGAQTSPPNVQLYHQHVQPRNLSQQFQVASSQSPQIQNLVGLPQQGRGSPIQNNISQMQQVPSAHSSPQPQSNTPGVSPQMQQITPPNSLSNTHNIGAGYSPPPGLQLDRTTNYQVFAIMQPQQQHQFLFSTQPMNQVNQIRQSNVQPQGLVNRQFQPSGVNGTSAFDYRRTPPTQIPTNQYPHDPNDRKSVETSLHQAHLRSPKRLMKGIGFSNPPERYYQSVKYLAFPPTPIPPQKFLHVFKFNIPESEHFKLSRDATATDFASPANLYFDGSLRVRLRVCLVKRSMQSISEKEWLLSDCYWPEHVHMQLNHQALMFRKKQHHAKDQPLELGLFVVPAENLLQVSVPIQKPFENNAVPFIAVEIVETLSHSSIYALPNLAADAHIPADETRAVIKRRLGGLSDPDEDEIAMVTTDLSINLADPFSYSLWKIPVRGKDCTHLECFDLETWLETRPGKKSCICGVKRSSDCKHCPKEPSLVDKWKCPLCQSDARPYSLRIDGFLTEVRQALAEQDLLNVKEIKVAADGSWNAVIPDDDSDLDSDEDTDPNWSTRGTSAVRAATDHITPRSRPPVEVICLNDN